MTLKTIFKLVILTVLVTPHDGLSKNKRSAKSLSATYGADYILPLIEKNTNGKAVGGILFDIYAALGKVLGTKFKLVEAPKNRESKLIEGGQVHLTCYNSKSWNTDPNKYYWTSNTLFQVVNRIYYNAKSFGVKPVKLSDLKG
ncbi:hypothetical protein N9W79_02170, partial [bacterium]|nr:hypothetical protein [bacterium]